MTLEFDDSIMPYRDTIDGYYRVIRKYTFQGTTLIRANTNLVSAYYTQTKGAYPLEFF